MRLYNLNKSSIIPYHMVDISLQQLLEAGCHFGHQVRRRNPRMASYIYSHQDGVHIIDLVKTKAGLDEALSALKNIVSEGGVVLWVGTKRQAQDVVKDAAEKTGMPYFVTRWPGGYFTNFPQLQKSVLRLRDLKSKRESGELKKYTKKEQLLFDREIAKLTKLFGGVESRDKLPQVLLIVDTHREAVAVAEANLVKVPVVGLVDTNADPSKIDYIVPSNDDAAKAIELFVGACTDAILEGKKKYEAKSK